MEDTLTLAGCLALLGPEARASDGPVDITVADGRIARIVPAGSAPSVGTVLDARNRLCTAGLINGHFHSHEHFTKGRTENLPLELWMNSVRPLRPIAYTARQAYLRTMIGALDALRGGTTTVVDDVNHPPGSDPALLEAVFQAYRDLGIRAYVGPTLYDRPFFRALPFVDEAFPSDLLAELDALPLPDARTQLDLAQHLARSYHPSSHRVAYVAAPSAPQRCSDGFLGEIRALADAQRVPVVIHVHETRVQAVTGPRMYGCTMPEHLRRIGFLKPGTSLIHGVWLTPDDITGIAESGATVQHNPVSNLKLGSGIAPVRALLEAGVNVSLGSDGCGSTETANMQQVVTATALLHKVRGDDPARWLGAAEAWLAGTMGGAVALGRGAELGAVEAGRIADLALYRLDSIAFTPLNDPRGQLVYAETGSGLDTVLVEGEVVLRDGRPTQVDEAALLAEITAEHRALLPELERAERDAGRITAAYAGILQRCRCLPLTPGTFQATLEG